MTMLLHNLIEDSASRNPAAVALRERDSELSYEQLAARIDAVAGGLIAAGVGPGDRVAVFLPKQMETVIAFFAICRAGAAFVPVNPQLKPAQVAHILSDCDVCLLITSSSRQQALATELEKCPALQSTVLVDGSAGDGPNWNELLASSGGQRKRIDADLAAVLYTSGSTGKPKGVMLSHRNMVCGAVSVATYLCNSAEDRLLTVLPFSFDYGFSQLSTAFYSGATAVLFEYLLPRDVIKAIGREKITGLAGVPPLWLQLARMEWPAEAASALRYITNSGGAMPRATVEALRQSLPTTDVYLMYGLTEAFRSTFLDPSELDNRPNSMGKAIPNAEVLVVRQDGSECDVDEPGELVHRGSLVALGYWNDAKKTAERFRPAPQTSAGATLPEIAVWSGDKVRRDADGFLYFVGRDDEMIKTSGYRVSPAEIEEVLYQVDGLREAIAFGVSHDELGQAIIVVASCDTSKTSSDELLNHCRKELPAYMVPAHVDLRTSLPRNPNGKIDRPAVAQEFKEFFAGTDA